MLSFIQKIVTVVFLGYAFHFGILWIKEIFSYASKIVAQDKISGAKKSFYYFCFSSVCFFLAAETYSPNLFWLGLLLLQAGFSLVQFLIYKKTISSLEKRNHDTRN